MNNLKERVKSIMVKFLDLLVFVLILVVGGSVIFVNGAFISNIINSLRLTGYIDLSVGIQIILVYLSLIWIPIYLVNVNKR